MITNFESVIQLTRMERRQSRKDNQNGPMFRHHKDFLTIISILCFIGALLCFAYEPLKTYFVGSYHPRVSRQSIQKSAKSAKPADYNFSHVKPVSLHQVLKARLTGKISTVGEMLVPGTNDTPLIHLPIGKGVSNTTLALAAGTMRANDKMGHGNYALAGHHMINKQALFTPFYYHAHKGTQVYITNLHKVYVYQISQRKMIPPTDVKVANNSPFSILTLITCNDSGSQRLMLRGNLMKTEDLNKAPQDVKAQMKQKMNNYNVFEGY